MVILRTNPTWMTHAVFSVSLALFLMLPLRFLYRLSRLLHSGLSGQGRNDLAIIGAGTAGVSLLREIMTERQFPLYAVYSAPSM